MSPDVSSELIRANGTRRRDTGRNLPKSAQGRLISCTFRVRSIFITSLMCVLIRRVNPSAYRTRRGGGSSLSTQHDRRRVKSCGSRESGRAPGPVSSGGRRARFPEMKTTTTEAWFPRDRSSPPSRRPPSRNPRKR